MSVLQFGCRPGHASPKKVAVAIAAGANVIQFSDPDCTCGGDCLDWMCEKSRKHWLTVPADGDEKAHVQEVTEALEKAGFEV